MADAVKTPQGAKRARGAAAPAQAAAAQAAAQAAEEKKGKGRRKAGLFGLAILVVLIVASGVFLYLTMVNDWGGVRTEALLLVNRIDPNFLYLEEQRVAEYNAAVSRLESDQAQLLADQQALESRRAELDRRQAALEEAELERQPIYRRNLSEEKLAEIKQTGKIYEGMDAQAAAEILSRLPDESYIAAVLYYMSAKTAAEVMRYMPADLSARVTIELLKD